MKLFCLWLQRFYLLGFLLFAWYIAPFKHFAPIFPLAWSLTVAAAACMLPVGGCGPGEPALSEMAVQGLLAGVLVGLTVGAVDWGLLDVNLLFEFCWAFMPLFLFDRFLRWAWQRSLTLVIRPR